MKGGREKEETTWREEKGLSGKDVDSG